jgi:hypothetical protein
MPTGLVGGPQSLSERCGEQKYLSSLQGIETQSFGSHPHLCDERVTVLNMVMTYFTISLGRLRKTTKNSLLKQDNWVETLI